MTANHVEHEIATFCRITGRSGPPRRAVKREAEEDWGGMGITRKLLWAYGAAGLLTLIFQIWWRSGQCGDACALSFAKAMVWSIIWPLSWVVFLRGFI
jgi:hypothetical protein